MLTKVVKMNRQGGGAASAPAAVTRLRVKRGIPLAGGIMGSGGLPEIVALALMTTLA